jgi:hypothetical protein
MKVHGDFECSNVKNVRQLSGNYFQAQVRGDTRGYCAVFALAIEVLPEECREKFYLDVTPDAAMEADTHPGDWNFYNNEPGCLWWRYHKPGQTWNGDGNPWNCLDNRYFTEGTFHITPDRYHVELDLARFGALKDGQQLILSSFPFIEYPAIQTLLQTWARQSPSTARIVEIGTTQQMRPINGLAIAGPGEGKIPVAVVAGQHPVEASGTWAARGIIEFLLSTLDEVKAMLDRFTFHIFPTINPDGLAAGRPQQNSLGMNMSEAYPKAAEGIPLPDPEAHQVWNFFVSLKPALILNFHGYYGPRSFGQPPYDGCYHIPLDTVSDPAWQLRQRRLSDRMVFQTLGTTQWWSLMNLPADHLENELAKACGTIGLCYEPNILSGPLISKRRGIEVLVECLKVL